VNGLAPLDYSGRHCKDGQQWDCWSASIKMRNVDNTYCVDEFDKQLKVVASSEST
jgi:hypothetical protein